MGVATNELVQKVGVAWTFRILGFLLWAICLPAACCIRQPPSSGPSIPKLQWYRWKDPEFLIVLVGSAVACFPLFIPPYFIPIFARAISHSSWTGIIALSVWNIASTVGRVCAGFAADSFVGPINSFIISLFLCGVSALAIWPFASSIGVLSVFAVVNGIGCGSFFSLFPTCLGAVFGPENTMGVLPIMWASWFFGFFFVSAPARLENPADNPGHTHCVATVRAGGAARGERVPAGGVLRGGDVGRGHGFHAGSPLQAREQSVCQGIGASLGHCIA